MEVLRWSRLVLLVRCGLGFQVASPGLASRRAAPLTMALDGFMLTRLDEIRGSFEELTARLADPDVISDSKLMMRISKQRSSAEEAHGPLQPANGAVVPSVAP